MGGFPGDTKVAKGATYEQCKAISTRSGRILTTPSKDKQGKDTTDRSKAVAVPDNPAPADVPAPTDVPTQAEEDLDIPIEPEEADPNKTVSTQIRPHKRDTLEDTRPPPPFPQRLKKQKQEYQYKRFLDILKEIHINLPLVEALQQMPNYAKFLKDTVSRKARIGEFETTAATKACLAMMHNKVPAKQTDPWSFTIPCSIVNHYTSKALCDPGASINLMPKSLFQKLGIGEAKPTTVMLQLADHSFVFFFYIFSPQNAYSLTLFLAEMTSQSSDSAEGFLARFDNPAARERYNNVVAAKHIWEEQGFKFDDGLDFYGLEMVREFYTHNATRENTVVNVRVKLVPADAAAINSIFGMQNNEVSIYDLIGALEDVHYNTIKNQLYLLGTELNTSDKNPGTISRPNLLPKSKLWNTFVKRNLMLGHNTQKLGASEYLKIIPSSDPSTINRNQEEELCTTYIEFLDKQQIGYKSFS
ncbi:hypothetical protein V6N13_142158 [Hibiscus sabdariffa]